MQEHGLGAKQSFGWSSTLHHDTHPTASAVYKSNSATVARFQALDKSMQEHVPNALAMLATSCGSIVSSPSWPPPADADSLPPRPPAPPAPRAVAAASLSCESVSANCARCVVAGAAAGGAPAAAWALPSTLPLAVAACASGTASNAPMCHLTRRLVQSVKQYNREIRSQMAGSCVA